MSIKKIALAAVAAIALTAPTLTAANAHHINKKKQDRVAALGTYTPGIDRKIERQRNRIRNGRIRGDLTWRETRRLRRGLKRIRRAKQYAAYDGHITRYERRELHDMLAHNSERIYRLRHNNRTANRYFRKFRINYNF
ncbi:MAG: hypothetical protein ACR2O4_13050 [Hyphomicrobiaceae bacterium]